MAFPYAEAPCPALKVRDNKALCGMVLAEIEYGMEPMVQQVLGIGCGCSMPDKATTEAEVKEFDKVSFIKMFGHSRYCL